ncbi:MAG: MerR family transcriptional regulator [Clostridiales bacterium]|nr:MerR family transcriptional regulator [Clostridiales bacterium]
MNTLVKIGELSKQLNVSTRTLRYYEEIGLIQSSRIDESKYRHYDSYAISRMNQILLLRRLSFTVKEIQEIYSSQDSERILTILTRKLIGMKSELVEMGNLAQTIEKLIKVLCLSANKSDNIITTLENLYSCERELLENETVELVSSEGFENKRILGDLRIIRLHPMRVAYYIAKSEQPENDAWTVMMKWVKKNSLEDLFTTRYLGFDNPSPSQGNSIYGYEVWTTVTDDIQGNDDIGIKVFKGGLYAVANTKLYDIVQAWQQLYKLIRNSDEYEITDNQFLEEHIVVSEDSWSGNMQVDLYCPIRKL